MKWRKRCLDVAFSALGLLLLGPLFLLLAFLVKLEDGGPVFYRQKRVGCRGTSFRILKFRTMQVNADQRGGPLTVAQDARITRVGRWLRTFKLDELPQLLNVVRGEMSLVGPRPEVARFVERKNPLWRAILEVRPGITDLASLVYRNEEQILAQATDPEHLYRETILPAKLRLNAQCIHAASFWLDLKLILLTVRYSFVPAGFDAAQLQRFVATDLESDVSLAGTRSGDRTCGEAS